MEPTTPLDQEICHTTTHQKTSLSNQACSSAINVSIPTWKSTISYLGLSAAVFTVQQPHSI